VVKVLLVVVLAVSLAQFAPSCGGLGKEVVGWVDGKHWSGRRDSYVIIINNVEYNVPDDFYNLVQIGDMVKYDPKTDAWSILRKAGT
jgi:hypothetical protein